ncbi:MAG: class E sortase [Patescibacteria group bacterium]
MLDLKATFRIEKNSKKGYNTGINSIFDLMAENINKFTEADLKRGHYFKINFETEGAHPIHPVQHAHDNNEKPVEEDENKHRNIKEIFKDGLRQIIASLVILVIGFLLLNWSAYYKIVSSKWDQYFGTQEVSPLNDLAKPKTPVYSQEEIKTSNDPRVQKKQIPSLDLAITPIDSRLIVPRINQNIPIVTVSSDSLIKRDWGALEKEMQGALKNGVVHYPGTSLPGQTGNVVITGHSSYFPWDPGKFKDVFALLHQVVQGDKIIVYHNQDKYLYEVEEIKIVLPDNIDVLKQTTDDRITLITCTPVGTNLKRLIVVAKLIAVNDQAIDEQAQSVTR